MTINLIIKHLRSFHYLCDDPKLRLQCCCGSCPLFFKSYSGLRKHLLKHRYITTSEHFSHTNDINKDDSNYIINTSPNISTSTSTSIYLDKTSENLERPVY